MIISRAKAQEALKVLTDHSVEVQVTLDQLNDNFLKVMHRMAVKRTHPDVGGDPQAFARVDWARCALEKWLEAGSPPAQECKQEPCGNCEGKGFVITAGRSLGGGLRRHCQKCRGTGDANLDIDRTSEGL